jgi:hypothetical protein
VPLSAASAPNSRAVVIAGTAGGVQLSVIEGGWDPVAEDERYARERRNAAGMPRTTITSSNRHSPASPQREQAYVKNVQFPNPKARRA